MKLNLGACDVRIPGFLSVDLAPPADVVADLSERWPWPDSSVDEILAKDVIEHIADKRHFIAELHRVLRPGGRAEIITPNASKGGGAFQDPSHNSYWTVNSWKYLDRRTAEWMRFKLHPPFLVKTLEETSYQDGPLFAGAALPDPVFKIRVVLEAVK